MVERRGIVPGDVDLVIRPSTRLEPADGVPPVRRDAGEEIVPGRRQRQVPAVMRGPTHDTVSPCLEDGDETRQVDGVLRHGREAQHVPGFRHDRVGERLEIHSPRQSSSR